jgi:DNA-binding transcriptional MerR regulator
LSVLHSREIRLDILGQGELEKIEESFPAGIPARAILEIFRPKGIRLSEATFRKYVQAGLLPRSRRVGRKGKHRGSQGLYPVEAVRRINAIKKMMAEGLTLEEIRKSYIFFKNHIDEVGHGLDVVLAGFGEELSVKGFGSTRKKQLETQLQGLRRRSEALLRDVQLFGSAVTAQRSISEAKNVYNAGVLPALHADERRGT